jgi:hypothetical protein
LRFRTSCGEDASIARLSSEREFHDGQSPIGDGARGTESRDLAALVTIDVPTTNREPFVKGLIHSDGTRIIATERKGSYVRRAPRYAFSNKSEDIKYLFCESCDALGVRWTRPSDRQIAVYRKESVARLDEFVGPKR